MDEQLVLSGIQVHWDQGYTHGKSHRKQQCYKKCLHLKKKKLQIFQDILFVLGAK